MRTSCRSWIGFAVTSEENDGNVFGRLGHQRESAFKRLSDTYSPSATKSRPDREYSKDNSYSRGGPHKRNSSPSRDRPRSRGRSHGVKESYGNTYSSYKTGDKHRYHSHDTGRSSSMKREKNSESPLSRVSESDTSEGGHWKSWSKRRKPTDEEDLAVPWSCEEVERWAMPTWCHMFNSTLIGAARVWFDELPPESIDGYKDLKAAFLVYFMQQKKYVKDPVEIHNIKQRDGETIEDFMKRFKVETGHHGKMMIATTAFVRGEAAAGKTKGHASLRTQDQSKQHTSEKRTPKEILAAEAGKFQPPPPMVTPVEKRSSNKFCDFHNDKGHGTDECMQLKNQIEELVRAGKLSHLIKEIKQGRDQPKVEKKEAPAKDKSMAIYMIQSWHRMSRQKVTQSFERVRQITFPSLTNSNRTEGPLVIEAKIGGHKIHRMYVDGGSSTEALGNNRRRQSFYMDEFHDSHEMLKLPADGGIVTICNTILIPAECATVITSSKEIPKEAEVRHKNFKMALHPNFLDQKVAIRGTLSAKGRTELCLLLKENLDIFTWLSSDMTGVPHSKLVEAGIMREVYYHDWLSNPVMVKKHDGSWRMCVDFTDLNKACPRDCYPLQEIDWKVESLYGYPFKCFLDAYKVYHQIQLAESDEEKTAFHTGQGVYCYTKMPFGLKNAGATYQQLVNKAFDSQIGWNIEVYVDDLVIKSHTEAEMLRDISETFRTLRKFNIKLNPKKCTFGEAKGMFLGYMISLEGIKPYPDKTEVVLQLPSPRTIKEVQSLNGKLASLNRFLSKSAEKSLPLFKTLNKSIKKSDFHWTSEAEQTFKQLKQHLSELPLLGLELNYTLMEKLVLSLVFAAKRLRKYFQAHPIVVITDQPIKQIMSRPDVAGRLQKWSVMMGEHNITYRPRTSVKGQILVDFLAEMPDESPPDASVVETLADGRAQCAQILKEKSIQEKEVTTVVEEDGPIWMTPIIEYLKEGTLPGDRKEASKLRIKARQYELLEGVLYRRSFLTPRLRCVRPLQADYVIQKIHEGSCSMHVEPWSVVAKSIRLGYYWPTMHRDARDMIRACNDCQIHRPGKVKNLIVAMDYFTKWIEAKSVATITDNQVKKFVWDNIICRFVKHPQSTGLVERANQSLGEGIKSYLGEGNKNWIEEFPHVLWAHCTMIKASHGDTPFSLTNETEAVIPAELGMPTYRTAVVDTVLLVPSRFVIFDLLPFVIVFRLRLFI
uniref:Reverse transcriptase domain-containing protein n=1 Tax=Tanacetum cinerariifolium TaxID=118510 RepID=A0A699GH96_TANCI|nr:reverse transcriptase domain-containing protein [Tanacetum cinerariifolium]